MARGGDVYERASVPGKDKLGANLADGIRALTRKPARADRLPSEAWPSGQTFFIVSTHRWTHST